MSLRAQLNDAMKEAMKAKDAKRLATVRLMLAALKDRDIAARSETSRDLLGDDEILTLLAKMIKQREESATAYDSGNRPELAAGEREEIAIIRTFMPAQMDDAALKDAVQKTIAEVGAASIKDMGKVMAVLKERYAGQMDFSKASAATQRRSSPANRRKVPATSRDSAKEHRQAVPWIPLAAAPQAAQRGIDGTLGLCPHWRGFCRIDCPMRYGEGLLEEIRRRTDLVALVGRRVKLVRKGRVMWGCCPFHAEKSPSFKVENERRLYKCFGCGKGGDRLQMADRNRRPELSRKRREAGG